MNTQGQVVKYVRNTRRRKTSLDLNVSPVENPEQAGPGGLTISVAQGGQVDVSMVTVPHGGGQVNQPAGSSQPAAIDVEELDDDDDVVISSPRAFEEAKKRSRSTRKTVVVDVEAEDAVSRHGANQAYKRKRGPPTGTVINCELYVNLNGSSGSMRERARYVAPRPPPPPPPKEPTFSCPVCIGPLVEEVTTKCGHIFCKACITAAINTQHKCPTCRQKLTNRNLIRVYLPATK
ncbi:uncharacterized protein LOC143623873 isoform X2 [Bidens hawaiensis]